MSNLWHLVRESIEANEKVLQHILKDGQYESLIQISEGLKKNGMILADEVGLGKTFIALALVENLIAVGGTVGIVVPAGLVAQWEGEIKKFRTLLDDSKIHHTLKQYEDVAVIQKYADIQESFPDGCSSSIVTPKKKPIALITHQLNLPLKGKMGLKRIQFPTLYWGAVNERKPVAGDKYSRFWRANLRDPKRDDSLINQCKYLAQCSILWEEPEKSYLKNEDNLIKVKKIGVERKKNITASFKENASAKKVLHTLNGYSIGKMDLLIVDEAHKSKSDEPTDTVLGNLLGNILNPMKNLEEGRVLGMTATPVELEPAQWQLLLKRIGVSEETINSKKEVIERFHNALIAARKSPANPQVIESLLKESKNFQNSLIQYVSRRRRYEIESFQKLILHSKQKGAHPHREITTLSIEFEKVEDNWKNSVLAMEAIAKTVKGTKDNRLLKLLDKRYASGLIGRDLTVNKKASDEKLDHFEQAREGRIEFWKSLLKDIGEKEANEDFHLYGHPRIQAGADYVELHRDEKVLIFGTYTRPLRALRNVVNYRYILRQIDQGLPVRSSERTEELENLYKEYQRVLAKNDSRLHYNGDLKKDPGKKFKDILKTKANAFNKVSVGVHNFFSEYKEKNGGKEFYELLPQAELIRQLKNIKNFYKFLEHYIVTEVTQDSVRLKHYQQSNHTKAQNITDIAIDLWSTLLKDSSVVELIYDDKINEKSSKDAKMRPRDWIESLISDDETVGNTKRSPFCRFMDGSMEMKSRRILQLQFNRMKGMPKMLIAQSQVGREGLNLHESCKRVLLFHPEWNPAVVEQQIGRVDRINSYWQKLAEDYLAHHQEDKQFPYINVDYLVFGGTYDQYQVEKMVARRANLDAQLFGSLLPEECLPRVPDEFKDKLKLEAPDFSPLKKVK